MSKVLTAASYNRLYPIEMASRMFHNRESILGQLVPVLKDYDHFGVCIIHRHCVLEDGEMMVARGNVSQPEKVGTANPERWLATGEAYEFTQEETLSPPPELLDQFLRIVGKNTVLGLFYIHDADINGVVLEKTDGRKNITTIVAHNTPRKAIPTAWRLNKSYDVEVQKSIALYECSACSVSNGTHMESADKMTGLENRTDLGLEIGGAGSILGVSAF